MTANWIAIALLTLLVIVYLLRPLMKRKVNDVSRADYDINVYRDQLKEVDRDLDQGLLSNDEAEAAKIEIKRRMLAASEDETDDKVSEVAKTSGHLLAKVFVVVVLLSSVGIYVIKGTPQYGDQPLATRDARVVEQPRQQAPSSMEEAVAALAKRMKGTPDDLDGWLMLGRSYIQMDRFDAAAAAYREAMRVSKNDPVIASDLGEVLIMVNKGSVNGEALEVFTAALKSDAFTSKARFYLALALAQEGKAKEALQGWVDLVALSPENAPWLEVTYEQIGQASKTLGVEPATIKPTKAVLALAEENPDRLKPIVRDEGSMPAVEHPSTSNGVSPEQKDAIRQMDPKNREQFIRDMVEQLAVRMENSPGDLEGWTKLHRSYQVLGETEKAAKVLEKIKALQARK